MPSKYQMIVELAAAVTKEIASGAGRYMNFLTTAANNFKYSYKDQLLIYAQKPDATACAEITFWNAHGRWVNRGAHGIALLSVANTPYRLRYVFDVSDTNSRDGYSAPVWRMQPRFEPTVIETLENSYGISETTLADSLIATAKVVAADNLPDYLEQLSNVKTGSFLEELNGSEIEGWFRELLENSVAFMLLTRCGYDANNYYNGDDFTFIYDFNTPETIAVMGAAVSDTAEMVLREIAATVRSQQREEQKRNRTFDSRSPGGYNGSARTYSERSDEHGSDVQNRGGLSAAQPDRTGDSEGRKVWDAPEGVSQETEEWSLHGDAFQWEAERAPGGSGPAGDRDGGATDSADGEIRGRDGAAESHGPDALGGPDEQHQSLSGGIGAERAGVRLTSEPEEDDATLPDLSKARAWDFYNTVRQGHPDDMVLFQVGDFFELYDMDAREAAESLDLIPFSREIPGVGRVTMCGVPAHSLERYVEQLRDKHDVTIVAVDSKTGERQVYSLPSADRESEHPGDYVDTGTNPQTDDNSETGPTGLEIKHHDFNAKTGFAYYNEDAEKQELIRISNALKDHRVEIAAYFADHTGGKERGDFVKSFFDNTYVEKILSNGQRAGYRAWDDVLELWQGSYLSRKKVEFLRWPSAANTIYGMILTHQWLAPDERPLPGEAEQIALIDQAEADKVSVFSLPQEAIDYILCGGSGVSRGKYRIYEQFLKKEGPQENIRFLKDEYGIGGRSDAIPGTGYWEGHDGKGITISRDLVDSNAKVVLSWPKVEKRIRELIDADRYLNRAEKEQYPAYRAEVAQRETRWEIVREYRSIIDDYIDFKTQLGEKDLGEAVWKARSCAYDFGVGRKKNDVSKMEGEFVLPIMREALRTVIADNTHLTKRCEDMLTKLDSDIAKPLEPTAEELAPPVPKEYKFALGDTVYLGSQEYGVLSFDENIVRLYDPSFPLFNKELPRAEFDEKLKANPLNDHLMVTVTPQTETEPTLTETEKVISQSEPQEDTSTPSLERAKQLIIEYSVKEFENEADFSNLHRIDLAYTTTEDEKHSVQVSADLVDFRMLFEVDGKPASTIQFRDLEDFNGFLGNLDFNELIAFAYDQYEKKLPAEEAEKEPEQPSEQTESEAETPTEKEELAPPTPHPLREKMRPAVIYPEIPNAQRHDFRITDDSLGVGTTGERYARNVAAIRLLKQLKDESRLASPEEQAVLSQYVGWGGLADCFDERNSHYEELKSLLSEDEYAAARESSLTAFYTPPVVIRAIYQVLENLGFKTGNVLEPSCGVGNFIGMKPEKWSDTKIYGVELDSISGRIAQQLYQTSSIAVQGFEKAELPDSFFDVAVGNVPFGSFKVSDRRYDKYNFLIHDYFFARTLDKVRPGGIVAFITSKGTMDKENPNVRKYIAQRANLLGAIRLPNNTFKDAAGTEVTSDILFLQKRESLAYEEPDWVHLGTDANGLKMNQYFIDNPDMVLGDMREVSGPFGPETACLPREGADLKVELADAVGNINGTLTAYVVDDPEAEEDRSIPADPSVRNFSYTLVDGQIYYRENSVMNPVEVSVTAQGRIKGLIGIRDCVRTLIEYQIEDYPDSEIKAQQERLNSLYDAFVQKYGRINSRANNSAFGMDSAYFLLTSLEVLDDEQNFVRKADMFTMRTIRQKTVVTSVDTASEALAVSLAEKACVDLGYMASLMGGSEKIPQIVEDLKGVIFKDPLTGLFDLDAADGSWARGWQTADAYLAGNVRVKLKEARQAAESDPNFAANVTALEAIQPVDLSASEISVRLGTTWLPPEVIEQFMFELLSTPGYARWNIHIHYSQHTGEWNVEGKAYDRGNIKANNTYGTSRINAYKIIESVLNLRDVRIFDYVNDNEGRRTPVLNKKETAIAQGKQELIKQEFKDWIWKDPSRRERLCRLYNDRFNSVRPREYDGSHINFVGMNPEITLRPHQVNAIARILYGGNTLLAHVVGAGKTYEIVAAAMEGKRLGLCQKSLVVVPNHLTEQWASEWLQLYPSANILVASKKDFETKNRKRFCSRIATGDYDAIIIGHSQFEKIPMSIEHQRYVLEQEREEIMDGIAELKANRGERFSIKQMERSKKTVEAKLAKLNDQSRKDDVVTFEELGVDRLFIDEAHYFKNLAAFSKMRNVGGISQTEAQKSSDLYMKCRYLDELTGGKGIVFATGTPISNTMVEMFTLQKYLQYNGLRQNDLLHFDAWASTFGETVTSIELAPEGYNF